VNQPRRCVNNRVTIAILLAFMVALTKLTRAGITERKSQRQGGHREMPFALDRSLEVRPRYVSNLQRPGRKSVSRLRNVQLDFLMVCIFPFAAKVLRVG